MYTVIIIIVMSSTGVGVLLFSSSHIIFMKSPMGLIKCAFICQSVFLDANMALLINKSYNLQWHGCILLGYGYFVTPACLLVKAWIRAMVLFLLFINLTSTYIWVYVKILLGWLGIGHQVYPVSVLWPWLMWHTLLLGPHILLCMLKSLLYHHDRLVRPLHFFCDYCLPW